MTRLVRRASLLVAFSLLTSAATAYAECAWVLWTHTTEPGLRGWWSGATWKPHAAYSSKSECEDPLGIRSKPGNDPLGIRNPQDANLKCLPDTVDPRGPKR